ncbi:hypothetical protein [Leclercia sp.]|uniref:hypothetical protein n=1 Tax=Leclercia sp. TaxID=1898428 RepID=UPI0028A644BD|nr:hypothetical protein [Leclercia sp.]
MAEFTKEEQVQAVYDLKVGYTLGHADIAMLKSMARQLLASMEQHPVAWKYRLVELATEDAGPWKMCLAPMEPGRGAAYRTEVIPLYAAPQLPQPAVAITQHFDTIALDTAKMVMCDVNRRDEFLGGDIQLLSRIQCRIDEACRAAMLQGTHRDLSHPVDPQVAEYEKIMERAIPANSFTDQELEGMAHGDNPQANAYRELLAHRRGAPALTAGWVAVPVEPTAEMQSAAAGAIRFDTTPINKLWTGNAVYKAMLAAAPQQEAEPMQAAPEGWVPCSPEWIERNGPCSCAEAPRIAFGSIGNHYHPHIYHNPKHEERP